MHEHTEAGHFERLYVQQSFNSLAVFLAATGGALTVYRSLAPEVRDLRILTCAFGLVFSLVCLRLADRQARRSSAVCDRAIEIEAHLGFHLRGGVRHSAGPRSSASLYRYVYAAGALVWAYAAIRTIVT